MILIFCLIKFFETDQSATESMYANCTECRIGISVIDFIKDIQNATGIDNDSLTILKHYLIPPLIFHRDQIIVYQEATLENGTYDTFFNVINASVCKEHGPMLLCQFTNSQKVWSDPDDMLFEVIPGSPVSDFMSFPLENRIYKQGNKWGVLCNLYDSRLQYWQNFTSINFQRNSSWVRELVMGRIS
jgi:hypothetical protein